MTFEQPAAGHPDPRMRGECAAGRATTYRTSNATGTPRTSAAVKV